MKSLIQGRLLAGFCLMLGSTVFSSFAAADPQSKSYSNWYFDGTEAHMVYTIAAREVTRLPEYQRNPDLTGLLATHLYGSASLEQDGLPCPRQFPESRSAKPGYIQLAMDFECPAPIDNVDITITTLFAFAGSHVHFAKFKIADAPVFEYLYTPNQSQYSVITAVDQNDSNAHAGTSAVTVFSTYIYLGFEHILIGLDHIAFLFTLLLLASRLKHVLLIVTGFTIGHSITLSLSVLELATPNIMVVEALIGFTIALVAAENIAVKTARSRQIAVASALLFALFAASASVSHSGPPVLSALGLGLFCLCYLRLSDTTEKALKLRPAVTLLFGLIHGFGFASVLLEVGLPQQRMLPALFGFNIGVEIGQIAIVLAISLLGLAVRKTLPALNRSSLGLELLSASLCGLGLFWYVQRSWA